MGTHDAIEMRRRLVITDTNPLAMIVKAALAEKDRRIDELLASNQQLRERAQKAEGKLKEMENVVRGFTTDA